MARSEMVTITNMCMVYDGDKRMVPDTWFYFIKRTSLRGR